MIVQGDPSVVEIPSRERMRARMRPSSLPMLDAERGGCSWFLPSGDTDDKELGRDRHSAWVALCKGDPSLVNLLEAEDREGLIWAADYFRLNAPAADWPVSFEQKRTLLDDDFSPIMEGTPDAVCGPHIFDLKWRPRDYFGQLAAYAAMVLADSEFDWVCVHILFGATQQSSQLWFRRDETFRTVLHIIECVETGEAAICDYCSWCDRQLTCPAFNEPAIAIAKGREDWGMQTYHCSEITSPEDMALAIRLSSHLRKWCDAVDYHKREWMIKQGIKVPGYRVREEKGDREITDLNEAARLSGIPVDSFVEACSCGIGALKKLWAKHFEISEAEADKQINVRLAAVIKRTPTVSVVKEKEPKTKE